MKKIAAAIALSMIFLPGANAQNTQNAKPEYLTGPTSWEFERFALPPVFSNNLPYKGVEELRFPPGMFNKDSANYFSYVFVARLDSTTSFSQDNLSNYLLAYFKGICAKTAKDRKLSIDTSQITVSIKPNNSEPSAYDAVIRLFGVFADGSLVTLNAEISVLNDAKANRTFLLFTASPQEKTHEIWKQLREIRNGLRPD